MAEKGAHTEGPTWGRIRKREEVEGVEITNHENQRQTETETHRSPLGRAGRIEERQSWRKKTGDRCQALGGSRVNWSLASDLVLDPPWS